MQSHYASSALLLAAAVCAQSPRADSSLEIRVTPGDFLIPDLAKRVGIGYSGTAPYYDVVLQAIAFVNSGENPLTLQGGRIEALQGGVVLAAHTIQLAEVQRASRSAATLKRMGFPAGLDVQFAASTLLPEGIGLAQGLTIAPGKAALLDDAMLLSRGLPDAVRVTATAAADDGDVVRAERTVPVRIPKLQNDYVFPVEPGHWFVMAFPGIKGHHRWTQATEHAIDISMTDRRGSMAKGGVHDWHTGVVDRWEDWYAFDKKVLAAADGKVVRAFDGDEFPLEFWGRRQGESYIAYQRRIGAAQQQKFLAPGADSIAVAGGNHIVIEHAGGEHSFYAHLAYGSVRVEVGQLVKQGEHIAGVGGTGEMPAVHLHFQVGLGEFGATARTVPVTFKNVTVNNPFVQRYAPAMVFQPGFFVEVR